MTCLAVLWGLGGLLLGRDYVHAYAEYRGFAPPRLPHGVPGGRVVDVHFLSPALHRRARYLVYLPPGYAPRTHRYPVLYLLHGAPGGPQVFVHIDAIGTYLSVGIHRHRIRPMLVVMPDGRVHGDNFSRTAWADARQGDYARFVLDVQRNVDQRFATVRSRRARVLAGYSEGAYGAINIGLHHPAIFGALEAWSGYYSVLPYGPFQGASPAQITANSPLDYAATLGASFAHRPTNAFLYTGTSDSDRAQLAPMLAELRAIGIHAVGRTYRGGHDWAMWRSHTPAMLLVASRDMVTRSRRPAGPLNALSRAAALARGRQVALTAAQTAIANATRRQLRAAAAARH